MADDQSALTDDGSTGASGSGGYSAEATTTNTVGRDEGVSYVGGGFGGNINIGDSSAFWGAQKPPNLLQGFNWNYAIIGVVAVVVIFLLVRR